MTFYRYSAILPPCHPVILSSCQRREGSDAWRIHVLLYLAAAKYSAADLVELARRGDRKPAAAWPGNDSSDQPYSLDRYPYPRRLAPTLAPALVDRQDRNVSQSGGD